MKIQHFQFCSSCTCLRIIKFFPIWCFWPSKCFYQDLTLSLSLELDNPLPLKILTWKKSSKPVIQRQYCDFTILSTKEPIFNQLLTQKLFLVHLVKSYLATGGLVMLEIIKRLNKVFGIRTNFNFSSIGVEVIVVAQLSRCGLTLTPLPN